MLLTAYIIACVIIIGTFCENLPPEARLWPIPEQFNFTTKYFLLPPDIFKFSSKFESCLILDKAFQRYHKHIFLGRKCKSSKLVSLCDLSSDCIDVMRQLIINLPNICDEYPFLGMDESYELSINNVHSHLRANTVWGVLKGLETFSQAVFSITGQFAVSEMKIKDSPQYSHRGILLDTARHYIPIDVILQNLDAMEMNKYNVFHWHLVDDQSFPYQSIIFPELSNQGAYDPVTQIYKPADIRHIVEEARLRGIRVIVEFDSPGHTEIIGKVKKELLTKCDQSTFDASVNFSAPLNPTLKETYEFMDSLIKELAELFPDTNIHLGGDEVNYDCWESVLNKPGITLLKKYFYNLHLITRKLGKLPILWQDVMENEFVLENTSVIVQVWKENGNVTMQKLLASGYYVLYSSCWYFNYVHNEEDWERFYTCDFSFFEDHPLFRDLVLGGEGCLWGEHVDSSNLLSRLWPRASTAAERLWSIPKNTNNVGLLRKRLENHRCNMVRRGIPAAPELGPGFCNPEYDSLKFNN